MKEPMINQIFIFTGLPGSNKTKAARYLTSGWQIPLFDGRYTPQDIISSVGNKDTAFMIVDPKFMDPNILKGALEILKKQFPKHRYHFFWINATYEEALSQIQKNPKEYDHQRYNLLNKLKNHKYTDHRENNIQFAVFPAKECLETPAE